MKRKLVWFAVFMIILKALCIVLYCVVLLLILLCSVVLCCIILYCVVLYCGAFRYVVLLGIELRIFKQ